MIMILKIHFKIYTFAKVSYFNIVFSIDRKPFPYIPANH